MAALENTRSRNLNATGRIGLIETIIIAFIILFLLGVLNYFNILPLSRVLPFLPHKSAVISSTRGSAGRKAAGINKTIYASSFIYIGKVAAINGSRITLTNKGSVVYLIPNGKTKFTSFPRTSNSKAATLNLTNDIHVGDYIQAIVIQRQSGGVLRSQMTSINKLTQQMFDSYNK